MGYWGSCVIEGPATAGVLQYLGSKRDRAAPIAQLPNNPIAQFVRRATAQDHAILLHIINEAYLVERFFVDGDRIAPDGLTRLMGKGDVPDRRR